MFFSADGKTLAALASRSGRIFFSDVATASERFSITEGRFRTFALAVDGKSLVTAGTGDLCVRETTTGAELYRLPGSAERTNGLAFSRDGRRLASIREDRVVRVWDVIARMEQVKFPCPEYEPRSLAFSPDGSRLAVGTLGSILIWTLPAR